MTQYNDESTVSPRWASYKRTWWIIAIILFLITAILWLLGYGRFGPGDRNCEVTPRTVEKQVDNPQHLARISTLEKENAAIAGLKTEIARLKANNDEASKLQARIKQLEQENTNITGLRNQISSLKTENSVITSLRSKIADLEALTSKPNVVEKTIEVEKLVDNPEHLARITALEKENSMISGLQAEISSLRQQLSQTSKGSGLAEGRVYFTSGSAVLPNEANLYLSSIVNYLQRNTNARVTLSGFHDKSGDATFNKLLATHRAQAVADLLQRSGIKNNRINISQPTETTGSGSPAEARRVELKINH